MLPFDRVFTELARHEVGVIFSHEDSRLPNGTYIFREFFSVESNDDRRGMELRVYRQGDSQPLASLAYELGATRATIIARPPQDELADTLLSLFESMLAWDPEYADQLMHHHESWRGVVDDPSHPYRERFRAAKHEKTAGAPAPLRWWMQ